MKKNYLALIIILLVSVSASLPLLVHGFYQIHDDQQIARLFVFDQALKAGQFPVRWVDGLGFGFGYPLFIFYPPFVYFLGEAFHLLGFGFIDSIKLVVFASILLSGISMYIFAKELWGKLPALVAAIFYILVPYRALDVYVRGALAESFSFVWLPIILWSVYKLQKTGNSLYAVLCAASLSLLLITHNLIFLPFSLILTIYSAYLIFLAHNRPVFMKNLILSAILCAGLSSFFALPALLEKKSTIVNDLLLVNLANYNIHFVYPQQLWNWTWGFGGSAKGLADGISFKIGKLHILISAVSVLLFAIALFRRNLGEKTPLIFYMLFFLSAFMTTFYSKPIWDLITPLQYLQFPWRFLTFTALFSSLIAGYFIYQLKFPTFKLLIAVVLIALISLTNLKLFKPQTYRINLTDKDATAKEVINWDVSYSSFEYAPKGVALTKGELDTNVIDIKKSDIPTGKISADSNQVKITQTTFSPHKINFTTQSKQMSQVTINTFNFPGWQAHIDGQKVNIDDNNKFKLISLDIPAGSHSVKIEFRDTPIRKTANMITALSFVIVLILFAKRWAMKVN